MLKTLTGYANRVVVALTFAAGLAAAVAPALADMDTSDTAGVIAGAIVILGAALKFLDGAQKHEERVGAGLDNVPGIGIGQPEDEVG